MEGLAIFNNAKELEGLLVQDDVTIREVLKSIDASGWGMVFVVGRDRRLQGVVTDGDVRRTLLRGATLDDKVEVCLNRQCVSAPQGASREELLQLMDYRVRCIPILDAQGRPVDFAAFEQIYRVPVAEPNLTGRELEYVTDCVASNWISSQGKYVNRFEQEFALLCESRYALATSNGTSALHLGLVALGVGPGDEVIVPDLTFIASANAVTYCGAKAVLVDVDRVTWTIDPGEVEAAITPRTRGIIPVHLYGHPAEMDSILRIADRHGLFILEDCAEALGARYRSRIVGSLGTGACFSFYGNKTLTTGEGGMLVTNDESLYRKARMLRDHGMSPERRYWHPFVGFNYRLTNLQAAVGVAQVERINEILNRKAEIDKLYRQNLSDTLCLILPPSQPWAEPVCWLFSILVDESICGVSRDELLAHMDRKQIGCRPVFQPLHVQPPYLMAKAFPVTEALSREGISLPSALSLKDRDIEYICTTIKEIIASPRRGIA